MIVEDIEIKSLIPTVNNPKLEKYLPKTLIRERMSFVIHPASNSVVNAIRRTIVDEFPVKSLICKYSSIDTSDPYVIPEIVISRIMSIPLDQSCPNDTVFELKATNDEFEVRDVKTREFRCKLKQLPFNETFTLLSIQPGKYINISDVGIETNYAHVRGQGMNVIATGVTFEPLDVNPLNSYENTGQSVSISNPLKYRVVFETNGTLPPKKIMSQSCELIIERVNAVGDLLYSIEENAGEYVLTIPNETHTIGNLFMRSINELYPDLDAVVYSVNESLRQTIIRVRGQEDINELYKRTIKHIVKIFHGIKQYFD